LLSCPGPAPAKFKRSPPPPPIERIPPTMVPGVIYVAINYRKPGSLAPVPLPIRFPHATGADHRSRVLFGRGESVGWAPVARGRVRHFGSSRRFFPVRRHVCHWLKGTASAPTAAAARASRRRDGCTPDVGTPLPWRRLRMLTRTSEMDGR
jgi:hypothetical protein